MKERFLAWPGWPFLRYAWLLSLLNAAWFAFVYGGCNWITAHRSLRVRLYLPHELSMPLVPSAVVLYMSIYLLFLAGPFIVRERRPFTALIRALALTTLIGGIGFLLLPAKTEFAPVGNLGIWTGLIHFAEWLSLDYNLAPSLHVGLSVCCIAAFAERASKTGRAALWIWAAAVALSTLLMHRHYVADVISGWLVGLFSFQLTRPRQVGGSPEAGSIC